VAFRTDALTGTNAYANIGETLPEVLKASPPSSPSAPNALPRIRLGEPFERLRDKSDALLTRTGARPRIFLAVLDDDADCKARANIARNFFELGGIEAIEGLPEMVTPETLVSPFKASGAQIACLCGDDFTVEKNAAKAAHALKAAGAKHIYLAGTPGSLGSGSQTSGVDTFVTAKSNALATLSAFYDILGDA
jgi:methylmalonyl-CoA mutase